MTTPLRVLARTHWMGLGRSTLAVFGMLVLMAACSSGPPPPVAQHPIAEKTQADRATKDVFFRTGRDSPIPADKRAAFKGLSYYPVDSAYHVPGSLHQDRSGPPVVIELQTSTHQVRRMERVGSLQFTLSGATYKLSAFAGEDEGLSRLFVPFGDLTNRTDTYGGGRYLDLDRTATGLYDLDFNAAYNPYCVYNHTYECPIPPAENRLPIAIRAGERMPEGAEQ
ncbi:MAG: DUF1684 domain-containing protein [Vicinamibacterales bacterium]